jgi:hypothetical protein
LIPDREVDKPALTRYSAVFTQPPELRLPKNPSLLFVVFLILPGLARCVGPEHEKLIHLVAFKLVVDSPPGDAALIDRLQQIGLAIPLNVLVRADKVIKRTKKSTRRCQD